MRSYGPLGQQLLRFADSGKATRQLADMAVCRPTAGSFHSSTRNHKSLPGYGDVDERQTAAVPVRTTIGKLSRWLRTAPSIRAHAQAAAARAASRYNTRPALANERMQCNAAGQVVLKLPASVAASWNLQARALKEDGMRLDHVSQRPGCLAAARRPLRAPPRWLTERAEPNQSWRRRARRATHKCAMSTAS